MSESDVPEVETSTSIQLGQSDGNSSESSPQFNHPRKGRFVEQLRTRSFPASITYILRYR